MQSIADHVKLTYITGTVLNILDNLKFVDTIRPASKELTMFCLDITEERITVFNVYTEIYFLYAFLRWKVAARLTFESF